MSAFTFVGVWVCVLMRVCMGVYVLACTDVFPAKSLVQSQPAVVWLCVSATQEAGRPHAMSAASPLVLPCLTRCEGCVIDTACSITVHNRMLRFSCISIRSLCTMILDRTLFREGCGPRADHASPSIFLCVCAFCLTLITFVLPPACMQRMNHLERLSLYLTSFTIYM